MFVHKRGVPLQPVDDDDAWIDWRRDPHVNTDTERRSELDDSDYHDDSYDDDSDDSDSDRCEAWPTDSSYPECHSKRRERPPLSRMPTQRPPDERVSQ